MKKVVCISLGILMFSSVLLGLFSYKIFTNKDTNTTINQEVIYNASASETTGASSAEIKYKGGAVFVAKGQTYEMTGNELSGHSKTYGGAVYVANGGKFIMTAGVIENNSAEYGGAVYVERGGTFEFKGGIIRNNSAVVAPAVYVENGATFKQSGSAKLENNYYIMSHYTISEEKIQVGGINSDLYLPYIEYGTYPQTFAGDKDSDLEDWFQRENPAIIKMHETYLNDSELGNWSFYKYVDNQIYVRRVSFNKYNTTQKYLGGETNVINGDIAWFKVEPIKWVVLNYEDVQRNTASSILVLSYIAISNFGSFDDRTNIWANSRSRRWCNGEFLNTTFSNSEKLSIINIETSDEHTKDMIFLLSDSEITNYFDNHNQRICSESDFALSNNVGIENDGSFVTEYRAGCCYQYTRTAYGTNCVCDVLRNGGIYYNHTYNEDMFGFRPAMRLRYDIRNRISKDTIVVGQYDNADTDAKMHYIYYGSYPQTYVDDTDTILALEELVENGATVQKIYKIYNFSGDYGIWNSYLYNGECYVRGKSYKRSRSDLIQSTYKNGDNVVESGNIAWFKVEPLRWYIINYDDLPTYINPNGTGKDNELKLLTDCTISGGSNFGIVSGTIWSNSILRRWLTSTDVGDENNFYNTAFTDGEKRNIILKTNLNNNYDNEEETQELATQDYVYCLSYSELMKYFDTNAKRECTTSDFALSNFTYIEYDEYKTLYRPTGRTGYWWTRSPYNAVNIRIIDYDGKFRLCNYPNYQNFTGIRPSISLALY